MGNMTKLLILGASGQIATHVIEMLADSDVELTLFARNPGRIASVPSGATVVEGDVKDQDTLATAMRGQDIVYANLAGDIDTQARDIVLAMNAEQVRRLIFVTSLGILNEVPGTFGAWNQETIGQALTVYAAAATVIEDSDLDYTILRPAWLSDTDEVDYETTARDEPFKGTTVSRKSVAALISRIVLHPEEFSRSNIGVNKPGTEGERPVW